MTLYNEMLELYALSTNPPP